MNTSNTDIYVHIHIHMHTKKKTIHKCISWNMHWILANVQFCWSIYYTSLSIILFKHFVINLPDRWLEWVYESTCLTVYPCSNSHKYSQISIKLIYVNGFSMAWRVLKMKCHLWFFYRYIEGLLGSYHPFRYNLWGKIVAVYFDDITLLKILKI